MATEVGSLVYNIDIDDKKLHSGLDKADSKLKALGSGIVDVGKKIAIGLAGATAGAVAFGVASVKAYSEAQDTIEQTNAVIKSTGGAAGVTAGKVTELATALQKTTKFGDEEIRSAENMLLTFTNIGKDVFPDATKTVLDMSQALGQDLKSSSIQLGKALNNPIDGITALTRVGVKFTDQQKEQIAKLVEAGKTMEAQKIILKELSTEFGGSAEAAGTTFSGKLAQLKNSLNDVQETIGFVIVDALQPFALAAADFVNKINWEEVIGRTTDALANLWNNYLVPFGQAIFNVALQIANYLQPKLQALWNTILESLPTYEKFYTNILVPLAQVLGVALVGAIGFVVDALNILLPIITSVVNFLANHTNVFWGIVTVLGAIKAALFLNGALAAFQGVMSGATASFGALQALIATPMVMPAIAIAAALASIYAVYKAAQDLNKEVEAAQSSAQSLGKAQDDFYRSLRKAKDEGRISQEEFLRRSRLYTQNVQMPGRALGGAVRAGQPYMVGERGREVFVPKTNGEIVPNDQLENMGKVVVNIGTIEDRQDADYLLRRLDRDSFLTSQGLSTL